jgi:nucleoside-triphosphatase THEP1
MDDIPKIGITGMPSVGKTQTLLKIIEKIEKRGYKIEGMITESIFEKKKRV